MTLISLRLPENLLKEADQKARALNLNRTEYIRKAVETLNHDLVAQRADTSSPFPLMPNWDHKPQCTFRNPFNVLEPDP